MDKPLAIGLDVRPKSFSLKNLMIEIRNWKALSKSRVLILYLECSLDILIKRFSLTRRPHPVPGEDNLELSIKRELKLIAPLRGKADFVLDTSHTSPNELRLKLGSILPLSNNRSIQIVLQSFSFRKGSLAGLDMVFDCRFLKNPNWVSNLKGLNGTDDEVKDYLSKDKSWPPFKKNILQMLATTIPAFEKEGKSYLSIGFGCTGGQHRSVFVSEQLYKPLLDIKDNVKILHTSLQK